MALYPAFVQAAMLFDDDRPIDLAAVAETFVARWRALGISFDLLVDSRPGEFYRLMGSNDLMVSVELLDHRADVSLFGPALGLPFNRQAVPDAAVRIDRHRRHVLVGVQHGVLPPSAELDALLAQLDMPKPGATLLQFRERLAVCADLVADVEAHAASSLVHWTVTDHLVTAEQIAAFSRNPAPNLLSVQPLLYDGGVDADGRQLTELATFGVAHFLGREIRVPASPLPWAAVFEAVLAFVRFSVQEKGYVVPDGDTFGPEDGSSRWRVEHVPAGAGSGAFTGPLYVLRPLSHRDLGWTAPGHVDKPRRFDDRSVPDDIRAGLGTGARDLVREWRTRREAAEAAGARLELLADAARPSSGGWLSRLTASFRRR